MQQPLTIKIDASTPSPEPMNLTIDVALLSALAVLLGTLLGALWRSFSYVADLKQRIVRTEDALKEQSDSILRLRGRAGSAIQSLEYRTLNVEAFLAHKHGFKSREPLPRAGEATGADFLDRQ